mgnify:CR=1 FL=1
MIASAQRETWSGDRRKFRPTKAVRAEVVLQVSAPEPGSFVLPMDLAAEEQERSLVVDLFDQFVGWIRGEGDAPDDLASNVLEHLLRTTLEWLPSRDDLTTAFSIRGGAERAVDVNVRERVRELLESWTFEELAIRGEVVRAYIREAEVRLRYPPTGRTFRVPVSTSVKQKLTLQEGQWLEIQGRFRCSADGEPIDIEEVRRVDLPDLEALAVHDVPWRKGVLRPRTALELPVHLDEDTHQLFVGVLEDIGLRAFSFSRPGLKDEVAEQLAFLWATYVQVAEEELAPDALRVREGLLRRFVEVAT